MNNTGGDTSPPNINIMTEYEVVLWNKTLHFMESFRFDRIKYALECIQDNIDKDEVSEITIHKVETPDIY